VQKRLVTLSVALLASYVLSPVAQTQSADPWLGVWKVDLAKSTFSPGPTPTVAATVTIERSGKSMMTTIEGTDPQGKPTRTETVWMFDGKDNPVKGATKYDRRLQADR
jgi:hypothetical protein